MNRLKIICVSVLMSLALLSLLPSDGHCSEIYQVTADQLQILEVNLNQLQVNNEQLKNLLNQSSQDLMTASEQSDELSNQIATLNSQLQESQNQIVILKQQLTTLKDQTAQAQKSLQTANEELSSASKSFSQYQKQQEKIESRLRTQKNLWEALAVISLGYTAFHN